MDNELDLAALRAFRAVTRAGSFAAASAALRIPKSTVSKRVADLESALGVRLIERTTRRLRVTPEGHALASRADWLMAEADAIRRSLSESGTQPRGHLRLAVPAVMGHVMMGRIAARFRAAYPDITLEIHFLDRPADLLDEGFDGAVRFGPMQDSGQIARALAQAHAVLAAAPGLPGLSAVTEPAHLTALPIVAMSTGWPGAWVLEHDDGRSTELPVSPVLLLGSFLAVRDALIEGAGAGLIPALLAEPEFAAGRLCRVLPRWTTPRRQLYFVYPSAQSVTARLRLFIDFLAEALRSDGPSLTAATAQATPSTA